MNTTNVRQETEKESVKCNNCGADQPMQRFIVQGFYIVDCGRCGLRYVNPRLSARSIRGLYSQEYFKSDDSVVFGYDDYLAERDTIVKTFHRRWRDMARFLPVTGSMLDVGAACGFLLEVAAAHGWKPQGLEVSDDMARLGRVRFGHNILVGSMDSPDLPRGGFDLVTIWDTIEHSTDPTGDLKRLSDLLKPGGILSIITPDSGSLHARIFGYKWVEYQRPQEHIFFFSHRLLQRILEQQGFEVLWRGTAGKYVSWEFALNRLRCYWPRLISLAEWLMKRFGLYGSYSYINPMDKMYLVARKKPS